MTINLDEIRQKHQQILDQQQGNNSFLEKFFQLKDGDNLVRFLPPKDGNDLFYAETKIHRIPTDKGFARNFHCLKIKDETCPICELYFGLWKTDQDSDKELARKIKGRARFYLNGLNRETGEVKIVSMGIKLFEKILGTMLDEDYGDITDLNEGHDFKVTKEQVSGFTNYDKSHARPKPCPVGTAKETDEIMGSLHNLQELIQFKEFEELKDVASQLALKGEIAEAGANTKSKNPEEDSTKEYLKNLSKD